MPTAPTTGVINGTDLLVYIDATHTIGYSTTCSLALNADMRDTSNKDSAGWKAVLPGMKNWTVSCDALVIMTKSTYNLSYMMGLIVNKTLVNLQFATANAGDVIFAGTAYVTSCNLSAANEANATMSISFQGTGALSVTQA
jgi:TP901-1 family phage major tail protein